MHRNISVHFFVINKNVKFDIMAALKIDDLEHLTNEEIRTFFKSDNKEDYAPVIKEFLDKPQNGPGVGRSHRIASLLQRLIISRFINETDK